MDKETKDLLNKIADGLDELKGIMRESPMSIEPKEEYVDTEKICQVFKLSKKSVARYRRQGLLKDYRIGRKIYFLPSEVKDALKKHLYGSFERK